MSAFLGSCALSRTLPIPRNTALPLRSAFSSDPPRGLVCRKEHLSHGFAHQATIAPCPGNDSSYVPKGSFALKEVFSRPIVRPEHYARGAAEDKLFYSQSTLLWLWTFF